jgi:hypothetical protein
MVKRREMGPIHFLKPHLSEGCVVQDRKFTLQSIIYNRLADRLLASATFRQTML